MSAPSILYGDSAAIMANRGYVSPLGLTLTPEQIKQIESNKSKAGTLLYSNVQLPPYDDPATINKANLTSFEVWLLSYLRPNQYAHKKFQLSIRGEHKTLIESTIKRYFKFNQDQNAIIIYGEPQIGQPSGVKAINFFSIQKYFPTLSVEYPLDKGAPIGVQSKGYEPDKLYANGYAAMYIDQCYHTVFMDDKAAGVIPQLTQNRLGVWKAGDPNSQYSADCTSRYIYVPPTETDLPIDTINDTMSTFLTYADEGGLAPVFMYTGGGDPANYLNKYPDAAWHERLCINGKYIAEDDIKMTANTKARMGEIEKLKYKSNCETNVVTIPSAQPELDIPTKYNNMLIEMGLPPITMVHEDAVSTIPWLYILILVAAIIIGVIAYFALRKPETQGYSGRPRRPGYPPRPMGPPQQQGYQPQPMGPPPQQGYQPQPMGPPPQQGYQPQPMGPPGYGPAYPGGPVVPGYQPRY